MASITPGYVSGSPLTSAFSSVASSISTAKNQQWNKEYQQQLLDIQQQNQELNIAQYGQFAPATIPQIQPDTIDDGQGNPIPNPNAGQPIIDNRQQIKDDRKFITKTNMFGIDRQIKNRNFGKDMPNPNVGNPMMIDNPNQDFQFTGPLGRSQVAKAANDELVLNQNQELEFGQNVPQFLTNYFDNENLFEVANMLNPDTNKAWDPADVFTIDPQTNQPIINPKWEASIAESGFGQNANELRSGAIDYIVNDIMNNKNNPFHKQYVATGIIDETELKSMINDEFANVKSDVLQEAYEDTNTFLRKAYRDDLGKKDVDPDAFKKYFGTNETIYDMLSPGLSYSGQTGDRFQYTVGDEVIPLAMSGEGYEKGLLNMEDGEWQWEANTDIDGNVDGSGGTYKWHSFDKTLPQNRPPGQNVKPTTRPSIQKIGHQKTGSYASHVSNVGFDNDKVTSEAGLENAPEKDRKDYFNQIETDYNKSIGSDLLVGNHPKKFWVTHDANASYVNFDFGVGNFIDYLNRDNREIPIQYNQGKPYVTIEGEWGSNDAHTIWLDDTWKNKGYRSMGEYIAAAIDSSNPRNTQHMGNY